MYLSDDLNVKEEDVILNHRTYYKEDLAAIVRECCYMPSGRPLSHRKATAAVNAVFDIWAQALGRGEDIESPIGKLGPRLREIKPSMKWLNFHNVNKGEICRKYFTVGSLVEIRLLALSEEFVRQP